MTESPMFDQLYASLNPAQKQAVDTVEGPVLVVAGPGTGKTHILTLRIANILRQTQANPSNILALTFTDSAARTMRRRLAGIVGEQVAREVTISTFHGFCELVLQRYPERFPDHASRRLMGDVEQVLLMREAIESTEPDPAHEHASLRPPKAPYTYLDDLLRLYDQLVREGVSLEAYRVWGDEERERVRNDASLLRKRAAAGGAAGELTAAGQEKLERIDKVDEAVRLLERYEALKEERGTYDFTDMLRLVIGRIGKDEGLRADLQEQYQYILADEHQDANALQHRLLELFALKTGQESAGSESGAAGAAELDDFPNIFAVGDEKQAIYRFQGADLTQFRTFTELFPRATVITLTSSFRSYQNVLDTAHEVIASALGDSAKSQKLSAERGTYKEPSVSLIVGTDPLDERAKITELISGLIEAGTPPHEIAVISRKNETADLIAAQLEARGLPVLRAGDVSLTSRPLVHTILSLMHYIADPTNIAALRRALLAPWWHDRVVEGASGEAGTQIPVSDFVHFFRTNRDVEFFTNLRERWPNLAAFLEQGIEKSTTQTPIECFSWLFAESGARSYLLAHADLLDDIGLIRQLIQHLEEAAQVGINGAGSTFRDEMQLLARASEHGMSPVKTSVTEREGFVTVITAHKAKGMEFQHVIIPDLTENGWEKGGKAAMIPSPFDNKQALDDVRRLFYVALTRAKDHAYLTYGQESKDGRERKMSVLMPVGLTVQDVESSPLPLLHPTINAPDLLTRLAKQYLTEDGLAPTALNIYLKSPPEFFASYILRMKEPPQGPMVLGNAVHGAIARYLNAKGAETAAHEIDRTFRDSLLARDAIFGALQREAHELFEAYVQEPLPIGKPISVEQKYTLKRTVDGVEVTLQGKIDAVLETPNGICIVDFKTGSSVSAKNEDYVRQLMLYTHLFGASGTNSASGGQPNQKPPHVDCTSLIALSKDGAKEIPVPLTEAMRTSAISEFDQVVHELLSGEWRKPIEPSDYDDLLKLLA